MQAVPSGQSDVTPDELEDEELLEEDPLLDDEELLEDEELGSHVGVSLRSLANVPKFNS